MGRTKTVKNINKFQAAVDYLTEYSGVNCAAVADAEGLVVARSGSDKFDPEIFCALALDIINRLDAGLPRLIKPGVEYLAIKTAHDWMTIARSHSFLLVVAVDREVNDLLNIRISRALDMISSHLKNKYPQACSAGQSGINAKNMEAVHV